jgi:hypothetical protein
MKKSSIFVSEKKNDRIVLRLENSTLKKLTSSGWFLMAGCAFGYPLWTADYNEN